VAPRRPRPAPPDLREWSAIADIGAITAGDDAARHVSPSATGDTGGLQSRDDTVMPRPAPSNHHDAVAVICEENDASTPKVRITVNAAES
jgi:hypothetical protein